MDKKKIKKISDLNEYESQKLITSWCLQNNIVPVSVPNGMNLNAFTPILKSLGVNEKDIKARNAITIKKEIASGLHTGFPDMILFSDKKMLFVENKVKNNKPSDLQVACHSWLKNLGFNVLITKNASDAIQQIKNYFGEEKNMLCETYLKERKNIYENRRRNT